MKVPFTTILLSFTLLSCNYFVDIDPPEVISITPANRSVVLEDRPVICVEFSESMDRPKTEEAFSISGEHQPKGHFRWENNKLYFDLIENCKDATVYTIIIRSSAEDSHGNNLKEDYTSSFSTGIDLIKPEALIIQPADGERISDIFLPLIVQFSEAISLDSVKKGFVITPYVAGDITLQDDNSTLVFTPYNNYIHGTTYTITLSTDIVDIAGNHLLKEYKSIFICGTDFIAPTLYPEAVQPPDYSVGCFAHYTDTAMRLQPFTTTEGIDKNASLLIRFSKAMQRIDTRESISISPPCNASFTWEDDQNLRIIPSSPLNLMQTYMLTISSQAKDMAGNTLDQVYNFPFKIYSQYSQPIEVTPYGNISKYIYQLGWDSNGNADDSLLRVLENDDIIDSAPPYACYKLINNTNVTVLIFRIQFANTTNTLATIASLDLPSAMQAISLSLTASQLSPTPIPKIWKIEVPDNHPDCIDIYMFNLTPQSYYRLSINHGTNGIKDTSGNYMLHPFAIYLNM
ncbi:MAG: Ig-like domain-containing protein [Spirochaetota bacterium]